jgi:choline kinase
MGHNTGESIPGASMNGIVLCAGRGGRLRPLTDDCPKCLLSFGDKTILERCLDGLRAAGIGNILIVTGYRGELVERLVHDRGYTGISFVPNPRYAHTNTAVSLNLALKKVAADVLVINGDVLFDRDILADLVALSTPLGAAVDDEISLNGEEIKVAARDGGIVGIGKHLDPRDSFGEAIGLYKIDRSVIGDLIRIYDDLESRGEDHHFFEKGFERLNEDGGNGVRAFGIALTRGRPWVEIDTIEDYRHAEGNIAPRL